MRKKIWPILIVLFVLTLGFRLAFTLSVSEFSDSGSYFNLRQVESIMKTGKPVFDDTLSYGGRSNLFMPVFNYIMAFFSFIFPVKIVVKILPEIFLSMLGVAVFLIVYRITENRFSSFLAAFTASLVPVFIRETLNRFTEYSVVIPLMFFLIYFFMKIGTSKYLNFYLMFFFIAAIFHPMVSLFILGLIFYLVLMKTEGMRVSKRESEIILLSAFMFIWILFLIYKKAFLALGLKVFFQNIPAGLVTSYFQQTTILDIFYNIGLLPFILGLYTVYRFVFMEKNRDAVILLSFTTAVAVLIWFRLIELSVGLIFLGLVFSVLLGVFHNMAYDYFSKTKMSEFTSYFQVGFLLLVVLTMLLPAISEAMAATSSAYPDELVAALAWAKDNTPDGATIAGPLEDGHLISAIAGRRNIIDTNYLLIGDVNTRYNDVERLYITPFETEAITILNKYNATYILVQDNPGKQYGAENLTYLSDAKCFRQVYFSSTSIYESLCVIK